MKSRTQWMLCSLSFALAASPALADGRGERTLRLQDDSNETSYPDEGYASDSSDASDSSESSGGGKGFTLGLRAGFGVPFGDAAADDDGEGAKVSDTFSSVVPLQLDIGYFFNPHVYLGGYVQYGFVSLKEECDTGLNCSASQLRLGVNVAYHFQSTRKLDPWIGLGVGYESLTTKASGEDEDEGSVKLTVSGFEFVSLQGGLDYHVTPKFSVGPYVTLTAGQYSSATTSIDIPILGEDEATEDIENKKIHGWIYGGVRAQLRF